MPIDPVNGYYYDPNDPDELGNRISIETKYRSLVENEKGEKEYEMGYAIQARDVIMLDAPKVYPSPSTPFLTVAQDYVGAINEIANGVSLTEDALFKIPSDPTVTAAESITKGAYVNLKLLKGPVVSNYYKEVTCNGYDCDVIQEMWSVYNENGQQIASNFPRVVYLQYRNRGLGDEYVSYIHFQKWPIGNYGGSYGPNGYVPGTSPSVSLIDRTIALNQYWSQ